MTHELLSTVVLAKDLPEHHLKAGDLGSVVECYNDEAVEVEFVTGAGKTLAVLTLLNNQVRDIGEDDVLSVRHAS